MQHKITKWLWSLAILALLAALAGGAGAWFFATKPVVETIELPAMKIVYAAHTGPARQVGDWFAAFHLSVTQSSLKLPCKESVSQTIGDTSPWTSLMATPSLHINIGCVVDDFPAHLPDGLERMELPAQPWLSVKSHPGKDIFSMLRNGIWAGLLGRRDGRDVEYTLILANPNRKPPALVLMPLAAPAAASEK